MKRIILFCTLLFLISSIIFTACKKDKGCVMTPETLSRSINLVDFRSSSPYYNQAVANFKFTQSVKNYKPADINSTCNTQSESLTTLSIQNATTKTITFDYNINFNLNLGSWNYQGTATIPSGSSLDVGNINNSPLNITLGSFVIQSLSITYR